MFFTVLAVVVVACAVVGLILQKNGELAGLGRVRRRSSIRAPHGRLVRTKRLDVTEESSFAGVFARVLLLEAAVAVVFIGLCVLGVLDPSQNLPAALQFIAAIGVSVGIAQADAGIWRALAFSLFGYLLLGGGASLIALYAAFSLSFIDTGFINMAMMAGGGVGCALAVAMIPPRRSYAREFEDGHVNSIQLSARSIAVKHYELLADPEWIPPVDRIQHPNMADELRDSMEKRAGSKR